MSYQDMATKFQHDFQGISIPVDPACSTNIQVYAKVGYIKLDWLRICRILKNGVSPGHYWVEIIHKDPDEVDEDIMDEHIQKSIIEKKTQKEIMRKGM